MNTRRLAERVTHQLSELLGEDQVGSHHSSLSTEKRLKTERQLKSGDLKAVVATASLELGLDVGFIYLVIQIGSPRSIATLLQRIGRLGHSLGKTPKGRLFALTRDELMECMALVRAIRSGRLDVIPIPECPIDVLAQQVVGEVANQEWGTDELFMLFRRAWPYRNLTRDAFNQTIEFLSEGLADRAGCAQVYIHHDHVQKNLRARPGARIAATSNAGTIPEIGSFRVVAEPDNTVVGTLDEALEGEGIVLRGHFRSKQPSRSDNADPKENDSKADTEWCHRRLLARIHRLTMDGLRRKIEPVTTDVYFQFLTGLQGLTAHSQRASVNGVFEVVSMLQGLDIAASAWEADVLKSRFDGYRSEWLDELCLGGEVSWARLFAPVREKETPANLTKVLPVSIFLREDIAWLNPDRNDGAANHMSPIAVQLLEQLSQQGAMFVSDLQSALVASRRNSNSDSAASLGEIDKSDVLPTFGELVTLGLVTSDGFAGLRGLVQAKVTETRAERSRTSRFTRTRNKTAGSGRWSLSQLGRDAIESLAAAGIDIGAKLDRECDPEERIEQWAWQLIRRWGVVFRDVLDQRAPRWWQLLQVYRRLEARGEIRGGRFISGVSGEQFALSESVKKLRQFREFPAAASSSETTTSKETSRQRDRPAKPKKTQVLRDSFMSGMARCQQELTKKTVRQTELGQASASNDVDGFLVLSACDPVNLIGIITEQARIPSLPHNRIVLWNGRPIAALINGELISLADFPRHLVGRIERALDRRFTAGAEGVPEVVASFATIF